MGKHSTSVRNVLKKLYFYRPWPGRSSSVGKASLIKNPSKEWCNGAGMSLIPGRSMESEEKFLATPSVRVWCEILVCRWKCADWACRKKLGFYRVHLMVHFYSRVSKLIAVVGCSTRQQLSWNKEVFQASRSWRWRRRRRRAFEPTSCSSWGWPDRRSGFSPASTGPTSRLISLPNLFLLFV